MAESQEVNVVNSNICPGNDVNIGCKISNQYNNPVFIIHQTEQESDANQRPAEEAEIKQLTESISANTKEPLSKKAHVYPGEQKMGAGLQPRLVAIKVVRHSDKRMREAQNLVKLTPHVNVVSIVHADLLPKSFEKRIYIVMERCYPLTLESYIKKRKEAKVPFNPVIALGLSKQIIEGMNHIHQNNIIHRDLKPGSVLFSRCGKFLKIIDFGMSKELRNGFTMMSLSTLPIGTDGYRAPETYNKDQINKQADIFSLGILLYHMWSNGCHPFGSGPDIWSYNIKEHKAPNFSDLLIPEAESAVALLKRMFQIEPKDRITIDDVKADPFIRQTTEVTVRKVVNQVWSGPILQTDSSEQFQDSALFVNKDGPPVQMVDSNSRPQMIFVPSVAKRALSLPVCQKPDGYLAMKKPCFRKLNEKILNDDMAWINVFNDDGERTGILLIIKPREYDVYGVFVENPDDFAASLAGDVDPNAEMMPKEQGEGDHQTEPQPESSEATDHRLDDAISHDRLAEPSNLPTTNPIETSAEDNDDEMPEELTPRQTSNERLPRSTGQSEFIPWWIYEAKRE